MLYQLGTALVNMNEFDRARPYFQRVLDMPEPPHPATQNVMTSAPPATSGPPGISTHRFKLPQTLVSEIQRQPFGPSSQSQTHWIPKNFEEAQAGALIQLTTIAQQQWKLDELIKQFEAQVDADPKNIKMLETLAQIYSLTQNTDKMRETVDRLLAASPNDPVYQSMQLETAMIGNLDYETVKKALDEMTGITSEARLWYVAQYASRFYQQGQKADAQKLVTELENAKVTNLGTGVRIVNTLAQMGKTDAAEEILAQLPVPVPSKTPQQPSPLVPLLPTGQLSAAQQWGQYSNIYQSLVTAYIRKGQTNKGVALSWTFFERTKPQATNSRRVASLAYAPQSYGGYTSLQTGYPSPTIYYDQTRLQVLQQAFNLLWTHNQQEALYAKLQVELDAATGRERIYPSLALSYCYWWNGQRDKAQEILSALQKEFPEDLTLKLNTIFVSVQTGQHAIALELLAELAEVDPRNRRQYYELTLQLAAHTGDTVVVRELVTKVINSPSGARALYQFSQKLQQSGLTQYAIAVAKKATTLAMGHRDPNFLIDLSRHLEELGRGQDAARIAERALRFANQRDRYGRTLYSWHFQQASRMVGRSKAVREREPQLVEAAQKDPDSFQAQVRLATFYESTNQLKKASDAFKAALVMRPKDSITRQRYAQMLGRSRQAKEAVTQYRMLLKDNPNALGYNYWEVMDTFFQAGKVDELVSLAKKMIVPSVGRNFGNDFAQSAAQRCINNNNVKAAIELYEKIIAVHPDRSYTYRDLASANAAAGEPEKAIQFLREKLESEDTGLTQDAYAQVQIVSKLTELYKTSGRIEDLVTEYEAKLVEKPENTTLLYLLASMKIAANDLEGADILVNRLLDDAVLMNAQWLNSLADAYRSANDRDRERRVLEAAITKMSPQNWWELAESYRKLGTSYAQQNEKEKAHEAFRKMGAIGLLQGRGSHEKEEVASTYMQHEMWNDAEALFTGILNDFSVQRWSRDQAQRQLMEIKRRRDGLATTTRITEKTQKFNVGTQRVLAQQHARRGEVKKAVNIYEQIAKMMPEDFESRAQLATLYSRQNRHDKAIDTWKALLDADPENTKYQDGLVDTYQDADKTDKALELAQQYITANTENGVHYARLAKLYAAEDKVDAAIDTYKKVIELNPGDGRIYRELAQLYLRKDDLDAAEKAFEEAIQHTGQEWDRQNIERQLMALYRRQGKLAEMLRQAEEAGTLTLEMQKEWARDYRNAGELEKAMDAYKKALEMTSRGRERNRISKELLKIYIHLGENDSAIELYETLSQSGSTGMSMHSTPSGFKVLLGGDEARETLIDAYKNQGKLEHLKTIFERRLERDVASPAVLEMVADIYRNANNHEKAGEAYQALCKAQPGNVRSFYYAAAAFHKSHQPDVAQELLNQGEVALSASNRRQDMRFLMALASICVEGEMYEAAIKFGEDAIASSRMYGGFSSSRENLYEILGKSYLGAKQYEKAATTYQQMASAARYDEMRKRAEASMRRAYKEGNLYEKQIPEQLQKLEENPDDPDAHFALAQTYEFSDRVDEAATQYEKISELQPDNAEWYKKIGNLIQKSRQADEPTRLAKASTAYERAIELEPTSYQLYRLLAQTYVKKDQLSEAEAVYRRALDTPLEDHEHNSALRGLWKLYADKDQVDKGIAILEELKLTFDKKGQINAVLLELLGNAYKEAGNSEKADTVYTEWLAIRQKEVNRRQQGWAYRHLAQQLLAKGIMPEMALELAERASQMGSDWHYAVTLGSAYVANNRYEEALQQFKRSMNSMDQGYSIRGDTTRELWARVAQAGKNVKDEGRYVEMVNKLTNVTSGSPTTPLHASVTLARFYHERDLEKAKAYMSKTAFIDESRWWIIGPFDNAAGIGYNKVYIPEDVTQPDPVTKYEGIDGQVGWEKQADDTFDGFIDFHEIFDKNINWNTAYAWTVVNSPDQRKAQLRFGSGTQAKLWLNGEEVFMHGESHAPAMDQDTIPVMLKAGENSILVKVCSENNYSLGFYLRLTDTNGKPLANVVSMEESTNK